MNKQITLTLIQTWLKDNHKTQTWLADQINMSAALLSQVLNQNRKLQTKYLIAISKITQMPLEQLLGDDQFTDTKPQVVLRGKLSNDTSQKQLDQLLWDIQHCVDLEATLHE